MSAVATMGTVQRQPQLQMGGVVGRHVTECEQGQGRYPPCKPCSKLRAQHVLKNNTVGTRAVQAAISILTFGLVVICTSISGGTGAVMGLGFLTRAQVTHSRDTGALSPPVTRGCSCLPGRPKEPSIASS